MAPAERRWSTSPHEHELEPAVRAQEVGQRSSSDLDLGRAGTRVGEGQKDVDMRGQFEGGQSAGGTFTEASSLGGKA